jgi:hypothetical protein
MKANRVQLVPFSMFLILCCLVLQIDNADP